MSTNTRLSLATAEKVALAIVGELAPACEKIEIAGSIRRRKPEVGDVEIVAVPRFADGPRLDMFAPPAKVSALDGVLARLAVDGRLVVHPEKPANGDRYKRLFAPRAGLQVDLFIVLPPAQFPILLTIRTGPAMFSRDLVTRLWRYDLRCVDGTVRKVTAGVVGDAVPVEDERAFFQLCGVDWLEPEERRSP